MNNHDCTGSNAKLYDMLSGEKRKTVWVARNVEHEMGWKIEKGMCGLREELLQDGDGILRTSHCVASDIRMVVDFIVVTTLESLITKEVNGLETFLFQMA